MLRRKPQPKDEREPVSLSEEMRLLAEINALEAQIPGGPWHKLTENQKIMRLVLGDRKSTLIRMILHEHGEIPVYRNGRWQLYEPGFPERKVLRCISPLACPIFTCHFRLGRILSSLVWC